MSTPPEAELTEVPAVKPDVSNGGDVEEGLTSVGSDEEDEAEKEKRRLERTIWSTIWQGVAAAAVAFNLAAMAIERSPVSIVAGIVALLVAPVVAYRVYNMVDKDSLRDVQNGLRKQVNRLHKENSKLSEGVNELETQVQSLKESESKLASLTEEQGSNIDSFVNLVKENRETTDKLKAAVKAETQQILVGAIIDSDFDSSANFDDNEIQIIEMRMKNVVGVTINFELLREKLQESDRSLSAALALLNEIDQDIPDEERVFLIKDASKRELS